MLGYPDQATASNLEFYQQYCMVGGHNSHFDISPGGDNGWGSWFGQLTAMSGDIAGTIR